MGRPVCVVAAGGMGEMADMGRKATPSTTDAPQTPKNTHKPATRPVAYSTAMAEEICGRLAAPASLVSICRDPAMPAYRTVMVWLDRYPAFARQYATARTIQADVMFEETIAIADASSRDKTVDAEGKETIDFEHINRSRLRVDIRKWAASKLNPRKYGDELLHTGADGEGPVQHALALNYDALTDDELVTLRRLLDKASAPAVVENSLLIEAEAEAPEHLEARRLPRSAH